MSREDLLLKDEKIREIYAEVSRSNKETPADIMEES